MRAFVEIHIKGLKMRKETKHNTILRKATQAHGGAGPLPYKLGPKREEEKAKTQIQIPPISTTPT
jgi:3-dehydroquinate dehydratase